MTHQSSIDGGRRGSRRRSGWRRCRAGWPRASSARARGSPRSRRRASPQWTETFGARHEVAEVRFEPSVELDRVDVRAARREHPGQRAEARPDLEHDIGRVELGQACDDAEDVVVDEEMLAERLLRSAGRSRGREPEGRIAFRSICALERATSLSAGLGEDRQGVKRRSRARFACPAAAAARGTGCRSRRGSDRRARPPPLRGASPPSGT